jgi:hypothetical protein
MNQSESSAFWERWWWLMMSSFTTHSQLIHIHIPSLSLYESIPASLVPSWGRSCIANRKGIAPSLDFPRLPHRASLKNTTYYVLRIVSIVTEWNEWINQSLFSPCKGIRVTDRTWKTRACAVSWGRGSIVRRLLLLDCNSIIYWFVPFFKNRQ